MQKHCLSSFRLPLQCQWSIPNKQANLRGRDTRSIDILSVYCSLKCLPVSTNYTCYRELEEEFRRKCLQSLANQVLLPSRTCSSECRLRYYNFTRTFELITKVTEEELRAVRNRRIGYVSERAVERMVQNYLNKNRTVISPAGPDSFTPSITPIAVHVVGHHEGFTKNRPIHDQAKMFKVGPWEYNNGPAIKLNVDVDFHHLMVPENGVYHVYSQVYFCDERSSGERQNETINEFLHFTVLDSTGYSSLHMDLMKSGRSKIGGDENGYYFSSYHSGLFELRKHDKIYMKVHLQHEKIIVSRDHEATFMGMYRIGDSY
ncbi:tumor necrosis factor ligand superfamily member 10-like isoform X2 [Ptychodera flava]|uniref:tumor necrosis factor ligand superfamily member 10-like isoform X2 n=1 Tax=Ptychodera flava TaxID=63121 RepID=UPI00396A30CA